MDYSLTTAGWVFMIVSCVSMIIWTGWCYYRVLTAPVAPQHYDVDEMEH